MANIKTLYKKLANRRTVYILIAVAVASVAVYYFFPRRLSSVVLLKGEKIESITVNYIGRGYGKRTTGQYMITNEAQIEEFVGLLESARVRIGKPIRIFRRAEQVSNMIFGVFIVYANKDLYANGSFNSPLLFFENDFTVSLRGDYYTYYGEGIFQEALKFFEPYVDKSVDSAHTSADDIPIDDIITRVW